MNEKSFLSLKVTSDQEAELLAKEVLEKMKRESKTLQEALNIDNSFLEEIYSIAYSHYNQGNYPAALQFFHMLAEIAPKNYKFIFGLASSFYQIHDFENAGLGFLMANQLQPIEPLPIFYLGECFLKKDYIGAAVECFVQVIELTETNKNYLHIKQKSELILNSLNIKK